MNTRQGRAPFQRSRQLALLGALCLFLQFAGGPRRVPIAAAAPLAAPSAPSISLLPQSGQPGAGITVSGSGYTPGGYSATLRWDGVDQFSFPVPPGGSFQVPFTIPPQAAPGPHTVTVCAFCGQFEFEQTASTGFKVDPPPTSVPPAEPPVILSFTLDAGTITAGDCTTARWTTEQGVSAQLTGDLGTIPVELNGTWQLCPPATQLYRLFVNGSPQAKPNSAAAEVTLTVIVAATPTGTSSPTPPSTPRPPGGRRPARPR